MAIAMVAFCGNVGSGKDNSCSYSANGGSVNVSREVVSSIRGAGVDGSRIVILTVALVMIIVV